MFNQFSYFWIFPRTNYRILLKSLKHIKEDRFVSQFQFEYSETRYYRTTSNKCKHKKCNAKKVIQK